MKNYDHRRIEKKWQRIWKQTGLYRQRLGGKGQKCYTLDMFPYPSGDGLHVGHPKGYIATDIYSRMKRMQGRAILHPMGWDAFGLPAENYAIQNKIHPRAAVLRNIRRFKKQLELLGFNYDWEREINTTEPEYYRWTQWIFLQMFRRGLAYRSDESINWCPSCKTGLANEDLENGACERCGSAIEKRRIPQWVLKITDYADRLLADLSALDWPEAIKEQQRNWIGKSEGMTITYRIEGASASVAVFTTRPDTNFGATFIVAAPDSAFVEKNLADFPNAAEVREYAERAKGRSEIERIAAGREKTGIYTGWRAVNQLNGKRLPIYVGDFVLGEVGTGVVVGVPGHDRRDFEFAQAVGIEIVRVVVGPDGDTSSITRVEQVQEEAGRMVNSDFLNGLDIHSATKRMMDYLEEKGWGKRTVNYKLRDWVFSRQRYWGEPIPLVFCEQCKKLAEISNQISKSQNLKISKYSSVGELLNPGWVAVPEEKLPVRLPKVVSYEPTGTGESPLAAIPGFVNATCPKCGGSARRETNTMPQWAGSCWYHLAYAVKRAKSYKLKAKHFLERWLPVDVYVGGAEHATRHLIYARFWHKFLRDIGVAPSDEPFARLHRVGLILASDGKKMSKRHGNVINPDEIVARFGADSLRVYEMFMGPFSQPIAWSTDGLVGARRFLERVWRLRLRVKGSRLPAARAKADAERTAGTLSLATLLHQTVKKITDDIGQFRFNTAASALMILSNRLEEEETVPRREFEAFLLLLAPFAPHLSEELWCGLGKKRSIHREPWPAYDAAAARDDTVTIVVQVNGKVRGSFAARRGSEPEPLKKEAAALPDVRKWITGREIKKAIVVPDRLINIVV